MTSPSPKEWTPDDEPPAVLSVHKAALQEIDRVVGNEMSLDADDCTRLRGILRSALSE